MIDYKTSGLNVTMTTPANTLAFSVTPATLFIGNVTTYQFTINQAVLAHSINDYAIITFPPSMTVPTSPSCTINSGISSIACSQISTTQLKVLYKATPSQNIAFSLASVTNYLIAGVAINYSLSIYDSNDYLM
jgi:hypothetical protein